MQRYEEIVNIIKHNGDGKRRYETLLYPNFPPMSSDIYIISKKLDRMDSLANEYYDNPRLWWVIQRANNLQGGTLVINPGLRIRIPYPIDDYEIILDTKEKQF